MMLDNTWIMRGEILLHVPSQCEEIAANGNWFWRLSKTIKHIKSWNVPLSPVLLLLLHVVLPHSSTLILFFRNRSKRQTDDDEVSLHDYFDHPPEICALGRDNNGSAFAVFFQEVSEFEACVEVDCIPPSMFRVEHTSREVCEDAIDGVPTCVTSTNFWGITTVSHCTLPIHWDDPFPVRKFFATLEYCGIETIPIIYLFSEVIFYPFQRESDCGYFLVSMPSGFPTPLGYQSPFDIEVGICKYTFYANSSFEAEWCGFPSTAFVHGFQPQCNPGPVTEDIRLQEQMYYLSKDECESVKVLEVAYQYRLEEDPEILWRWKFHTS